MRDMSILSRPEQDAIKDEYVAALPGNLARFLRRAEAAELNADGSVESLDEVGAWFLRELWDPAPSPGYQLPVWWGTSHPKGETGGEFEIELSRDQIALVDELQAYYASVLMGACPDARWVVFRRGSKKDIMRGWAALDLGRPDWPSRPVAVAFIAAMRAIDHGPIADDFLVRKFDYELPGLRERHRAAGSRAESRR